jgi:hypothetical protein
VIATLNHALPIVTCYPVYKCPLTYQVRSTADARDYIAATFYWQQTAAEAAAYTTAALRYLQQGECITVQPLERPTSTTCSGIAATATAATATATAATATAATAMSSAAVGKAAYAKKSTTTTTTTITTNTAADSNSSSSSSGQDDVIAATKLGRAIFVSALSPDAGLLVFNDLQKTVQCGLVLSNDLHLTYLLTPSQLPQVSATTATCLEHRYTVQYYTVPTALNARVVAATYRSV